MLPQMNGKFEAFIAPARENHGGLLLLGAISFLVLAYCEFTMLVFGLVAGQSSWANDLPFSTAWHHMGMDLISPHSPQIMIFLLATFTAMFAAVWATVALFRGQSLRVLIGPGAVLRNFLMACAVLAPVFALVFAFAIYDGAVPYLSFDQWIRWMPLALPLLLLQVSSEELVFRGYLMQELASRFTSRWIWLVLPAIVFGCLHLDTQTYGLNSLLVVAGTTLFGFVAADLTVRTGNLGAAIGLHFINNLSAMMFVSLDGTMNGLSLYVTKVHVSEQVNIRGLLIIDLAMITGLYILYLLFIRWRERK